MHSSLLPSWYEILFFIKQIFYWLTDWLNFYPDKHNSIMAIAQFIHCSKSHPPDLCLFTNRSSSNACIMILPKLTFVLLCALFLSSLPCRWQFVVRPLWIQYISVGLASHIILCLECYLKCLKSWKGNKV